ncbi:MAG: hypothetical protein GWP17_03175 [Aquificales bacterium]|nr:hypothetical protein [Aquificales bacterium]
MSKRFALLVGMTAYQDDRLDVTASNTDIRALVERLRDPENGRFDRVVPLLNQTALDLQLGIASFFEQEMKPGDLVLFYFAGHSLIHHQNIYLATTDTFTEEYLDVTTVEIDFVRRRLNASPAQQIVLLDCEFSFIGATDRHTDGFEMLASAFQTENRAVLVAPQLTNLVVDGLQGAADNNEDGTITFAELSAYVQSQLPETEPPTIAANDELNSLPLASCAMVAASAGSVQAVPIIPPPPTPSPAENNSPVSQRQRYGVIALILLLLLTAFGFYAVSSGLFASDGEVESQPEPSPTTAVAAIIPETSAPASRTPTTGAEETAVVSKTVTTEATATATDTPTATATTASPTLSAIPEPTVTVESTPTEEATATNSPTPEPTSEPVPMDVVAQQAFLRAGPGINYRILSFPVQGTAVTVIARNEDATWYNVILEDDSSGWLHVDVLTAADEDAFASITIAATIPVPLDDFYDPVLTPSGDSLSVQVYHTYIGTQGENAQFQARLLPETDLVQPAYLNGQDLGIGLLIVAFNRVREGDYSSSQVELCMISEMGEPFYCETFSARKSW